MSLSNTRPLHANRDPLTYHDNPYRTRQAANDSAPRKKFVAKGHDSQLQDAQFGKFPVEITTINDAAIFRGTISRRDKWTITLAISSGPDAGCEVIIYKSAIETVLIRKPATVEQ